MSLNSLKTGFSLFSQELNSDITKTENLVRIIGNTTVDSVSTLGNSLSGMVSPIRKLYTLSERVYNDSKELEKILKIYSKEVNAFKFKCEEVLSVISSMQELISFIKEMVAISDEPEWLYFCGIRISDLTQEATYFSEFLSQMQSLKTSTIYYNAVLITRR